MNRIVIVGAGPTGLALGWLLSKYQVTIVESLPNIGGCHTSMVERNNNKIVGFSEHGPRVYTDRSKYFRHILNQMGLSWDKLFTPYKFQISDIGDFKRFTFNELKSFAFAWINSASNKTTSVYDFMVYNNFTKKSQDYVARLCRTTDGADSKNYSLWKFLQLVNQQYLYTLYQPTSPDGLMQAWKAALLKRGVKIITSCTVSQLHIQPDNVITIKTNKGVISADHLILACPPKQVNTILQASKLSWCLPSLTNEYLKNNSYNRYISISFIWTTDVLMVNRVWGFPSTKHGLIHVVLSDYWNTSNTVISTALTILDDLQDKTEAELCSLALNELRESYPNIPEPSRSIVNHNNLTAFIQGVKPAIKLGPATLVPNLWTIGTHNGSSDYAFTSIESAVESAYKFVLPDLVIQSMSVNILLILLVVLLALITILYKSIPVNSYDKFIYIDQNTIPHSIIVS